MTKTASAQATKTASAQVTKTASAQATKTTSNFPTRKTLLRLLFVFLWISTSCMYMFSPVYAVSRGRLESGTSGTCVWKYETVGDDMVLTIAPANGSKGTLGPFLWCDSICKEYTTRVVVKGKVKAPPSTDSMFERFSQARSIDLSGLDVTGVISMKAMFFGCHSVTSLDVSRWDVSRVTDMRAMFFECLALTSLDLSAWNISDETRTESMFRDTLSLREIALGRNSRISDNAEFQNAGSRVGTRWMQINLGEGGTAENPKGKVFESYRELIAFHCDRTKRETDKEAYLRVAPAKLIVSFSKGAADVAGEMTSQIYDTGATKALTKNAYKRPGYAFSGWKACDGNSYRDKQSIENNYFGKALPNEGAAQRTLELVAQWKAVITYEVKEGTKATLSRVSEEIDSCDDPLGTEVATQGEASEGTEIRWTVRAGGNDSASDWSHEGATLGKDEVKAIALKDGAFVPTTFVAEPLDTTTWQPLSPMFFVE